MGFFDIIKKEIESERPKTSSQVKDFFERLKGRIKNAFVKISVNNTPTVPEEILKQIADRYWPIAESVLEKVVDRHLESSPEDEWDSELFIKRIHKDFLVQLKKEQKNHESAHFDDSITPYFLQDRGLLFYSLNQHWPSLCATVDKKIREAFLSQKKDDKTLLEMVIIKGNKREVSALIVQGYKDSIPEEQRTRALEIIKKNNQNDLLSLFKKKVPVVNNVYSAVQRMGASTSPVKKIGIATPDQRTPLRNRMSSSLEQQTTFLSPTGSSIASTPKGTPLYQIWSIQLMHSGKTEKFGVFIDHHEKSQSLSERLGRGSLQSSVPKKLVFNQKVGKEVSANVTQEIIKNWGGTERTSYPDQNQIMGCSATEIARAIGANNPKQWHWCHIIAYSLGGPGSGRVPNKSLKNEIDSHGPQREGNLVVGTVEANGHMLIIEDLCKKLAYKKDVFIKATPKFVPGLEAFHVAETLEYCVQDREKNPNQSFTITFDMLSRRKISPQECEAIAVVFKEFFLGEKASKSLPQGFSMEAKENLKVSPNLLFSNKRLSEPESPTPLTKRPR